MKYGIVDISNLYHRATHSVFSGADAFTKSGMALHIVFRSMRKMFREHKIDHFVFAVDTKSWRYEIFPEYKAKRRLDRLNKTAKEKEDNQVLFDTLNDFIDFISEKTQCTVLKTNPIEADDFVARWIQTHPADEHIIISGDSDFIQLLDTNVSIYDGVNDRTIKTTGVFEKEEMIFSIKPKDGKIKILDSVSKAKKQFDAEQSKKEKEYLVEQKKLYALNSSHIPQPFEYKEFEYSLENEWWKKALFIKCIRGDVGDGIFSAYPGARYNGNVKKTGICEAWEDRISKGYNYNNFMLQRWNKLVFENGEKKSVETTAKKEYEFNRILIDLTCQPDYIKEIMDKEIEKSIDKKVVGHIGLAFLKFCAKHSLNNLSKEAEDHVKYLRV